MPIRVTVWNEFRHEKTNEEVRAIYPDGIQVALKAAIEKLLGNRVVIRTATLDEPNHGLADDVLAATDVMLWWGHMHHQDVSDEIANKVAERVREGMGLIVLHSGHYAKPFVKLMGTNCHLKWRVAQEKERLWNVLPGHPITRGLSGGDCIELPQEEMYGEHFDIPDPDELLFVSWFEGGEVFRSGCVWRRGAGKVFYFRPGHETYPTFHNADIQRVIANAVEYVAPVGNAMAYRNSSPNIREPLSPISAK